MSSPYLGEIRMFAGNFAPVGWAFCNGQLLSIADNEALFALIGTTYGGDGQSTFGLPNLQGRFPIHQGPGFVLGQLAGEETVTLTAQQLPIHAHAPLAVSNTANQTSPVGAVWASSNARPYAPPPGSVQMRPGLAGAVGGNQPHDNMSPFLAVSFIIALQGIFPTQT